jgi:thymidylate synthase ThyX
VTPMAERTDVDEQAPPLAAPDIWFVREEFTDEERALLAPHFTELDGPVFALVDLPEVVKGALFARYSRSPKSLRRLFLDEFSEAAGGGSGPVGVRRAEELYRRVFLEYGDDSVAQLGGVHLACEQASQPLAKVLEWGRLAGYLEQSTRYVPYDDRPGGRFRYLVPPEVAVDPELEAEFRRVADGAFETYARWLDPLQDLYREWFPQDPGDSDFVYRSSIRARACDTLRGLLPAATRTNVGIYATGQSYEQLLIRMRANPLAEVRTYADLMLRELRKVIPAFLERVDRPDRGGEWSEYLASTREATRRMALGLLDANGDYAVARPDELQGRAGVEVELTEFDPDGEAKLVAACLYAADERMGDRALQERTGAMSAEDRARVLRAYVGERRNRRHKPGRAFERTDYRFDVLCDYGAFRDLQRHRMLTIEWQRLSPTLGYDVPPELEELGGAVEEFHRVMQESSDLHFRMVEAGLGDAAQYAVAMAYRIRFVMQMNAREAMHLIELRSAPQGHPTYRLVAQRMHELIAEVHPSVAAAMSYVDHSPVELGRLGAERRSEARRRDLAGEQPDGHP